MRVIAAIHADLDATPLGTRSRLADELHGRSVLARTVARVQRAREPAAVFLLCPEAQSERCRRLIDGTGVAVRPIAISATPHRALVRVARKWSLDGWRGGLGGASHLDEYADAAALVALATAESADAVISVPGGAIVVDPDLMDAEVRQFHSVHEEVRMVFCQAPPGLAPVLFARGILEELAAKHVPPGWILAYKPDAPVIDLIFKPCCLMTAQAARHAAGRLIADTDTAMARLTDLLAVHPDPGAETVGRFLIERDRTHVPPQPREIEIELTTDDPYPDTPLRPRGTRVGRRGPIAVELIERVFTEMSSAARSDPSVPLRGLEAAPTVSTLPDDLLVVLGGSGDPLLHPQLGDILALLRRAGVYGLAIRTTGTSLTEPIIRLLIEHQVDIVNVLLDAWTPQLYAELTGGGRLAHVLAGLDALAQARDAAGSVCPIVVPEMTKAQQNMAQLDAFFDGWIRKVGAVNLGGFNHFSGRLPDHGVINMCPPTRTPCRRIFSRCTILADGRVTFCDQDFAGQHTIGSIAERPLSELWHGAAMKALRDRQLAGDWSASPLCPECTEWHRP